MRITFPDTWWPWPDKRSVYAHITDIWHWASVHAEAMEQALEEIGKTMSKNSEALAELDAQIGALEAYVLSDDETDALEVQSRVQRLKDLLAAAQPAPVEPEPEQ